MGFCGVARVFEIFGLERFAPCENSELLFPIFHSEISMQF